MRLIASLLIFAALALGPAAGRAASACTWGGNAAAATGTFGVAAPGLSNTSGAAEPLDFWAEGELAGVGTYCTGVLRIEGTILPGSMCRLFYITGTVSGIPGVKWFFDIGGAYSVAQFYGPDGKIVGSYGASVVHDGFVDAVTACNAAGGLTGGKFYATVEVTL